MVVPEPLHTAGAELTIELTLKGANVMPRNAVFSVGPAIIVDANVPDSEVVGPEASVKETILLFVPVSVVVVAYKYTVPALAYPVIP